MPKATQVLSQAGDGAFPADAVAAGAELDVEDFVDWVVVLKQTDVLVAPVEKGHAVELGGRRVVVVGIDNDGSGRPVQEVVGAREGDVAAARVAGGTVAGGVVAPTGHGKAAALEVLHDAGAIAAGQVDAVRGRVPMNAVAAEGDDEAAVFRLVREEGDKFVAAVGVGFEGVDENRGRAEAADFGLAAFAVDDAVGNAVGMIDVGVDAAGPGDAVG